MNDLDLLKIYKSTFDIDRPMSVEESDGALRLMRRMEYYVTLKIPVEETAEVIHEDWNITTDRKEALDYAKELIKKIKQHGHA